MTLRNKALMKNIEQVGYHDLQKRPAFQIVMQKCGEKYYLYCASWRHNGWSILDVTDPTNPKMIQFKEGPWINEDCHDGQNTCKIQVADGLMLTAHGTMAGFLTGCPEGAGLVWSDGVGRKNRSDRSEIAWNI